MTPIPKLALENTRFWAPLSLTAEQKHSIDDPIEMEKAADALPIEQVAKRWIVASDPDEAVEKVGEYVDGGSTTWCSTRPVTTSADSWSCSRRIWRPGCGGWAERQVPGLRSTSRAPEAGDPASRRSRWAAAPIDRDGRESRCVPADYARSARTATTSWNCCCRTPPPGLPYEQCVGVTYQQLHADSDAAIAEHRRRRITRWPASATRW